MKNQVNFFISIAKNCLQTKESKLAPKKTLLSVSVSGSPTWWVKAMWVKPRGTEKFDHYCSKHCI